MLKAVTVRLISRIGMGTVGEAEIVCPMSLLHIPSVVG